MKNFLLPVISIFLLFSFPAKASHMMGADLSWQCVGQDSFLVTLTLYRDCKGIPVSSSYDLTISSTLCNKSFTQTINQVGNGEDITPICPPDFVQDACNGGSKYPGVQQYFYTGIIVLPKKCTDWTVSFYSCCRNAAITNLNISTYAGMYVECHINNTITPCDNSPIFTNPPVPYFCDGVQANYNQGAYDPDGDSLVYTLINPMDYSFAPVNIPYYSPWSSTYPLTTTPANSFGFSSSTGQISFTPNGVQITVVAVRVDEYRNGVKIGSTMRDMQFIVISCVNNTPPVVTLSPNVTGGVLDNGIIEVCPNNNLSFTMYGIDSNIALNLYFSSNITTVLPTSSFNTNGDNPDTTTFSWTPTLSDTGKHFFTVTLQNDACPITSTQIFSFEIDVIKGITAGPDLSVCPGAPAQLSASGSAKYLWTPKSSLNNDTIANPIASPFATTLYIVTGNLPAGCKNVDTQMVIVDTSYRIHAGPNVAVCKGDSTQLNATGGGTNFVWTPAIGLSSTSIVNPIAKPTTTTTYMITGTGSNGCLSHDSLVVTVNPLPVPNAGLNQTICPGASVPLSANPNNYVSYLWTPSASLNNSTISNPIATPSVTTTYSVTVVDTNGCAGSSNVIVDVYPDIPPTTVTTASYCQNGSAVLDGGAGTAWQWTPSTGLSSTNIRNPLASPSVTTTYYVTITDVNGCITTDSVIVSVFPPLIPSVSNDTTINKFTSAYLHAYGGVTYSWSPTGGLSNPNISNPTATPPYTTMYYVTITDANGCVAVDSILVTVIYGCGPIIMPNAFTPNGDGKNDVIFAYNTGVYTKLVSVRIYDRWGELLFESNDLSKGWDGTYKGTNEPIGTYVYVIESDCIGQRSITKGNITLLR